MNLIGRQKGMTSIGWALVFMLIAVVTLVILKLLPIYLDGFAVKSSLASLKNEHNISKTSPSKIKTMLLKRFDINTVTDVTKDDIYIETSQGTMTVEVEYEVRDKLIGNIDVVVMFNEKIEVPAN